MLAKQYIWQLADGDPFISSDRTCLSSVITADSSILHADILAHCDSVQSCPSEFMLPAVH